MEFDFRNDIILEDDIAFLRPLQIDDVENLLPFSISEPELWKHSSMPAVGKNQLETYISKAIENRQGESEFAFIIYDKRTSEYAGSTRFYDIQLKHKTLQLGYTWYGKKFQRTGLNRHCKFLLLQFAFEKMGMERVEFRADTDNSRSIEAMKAIGCTVEGILRSNLYRHDGSRRSSIVLSILKDEWFDSGKEALLAKL